MTSTYAWAKPVIVHWYANDLSGRAACGRKTSGLRLAGNRGPDAVTCKHCLAKMKKDTK